MRDVYDLGDCLLMVATDRLSAFDVVLPIGIPGKGVILNQLSLFWFERLQPVVENHVLTAEVEEYPSALRCFRAQLEGRSMLVRKTEPLPVECVVRGYLAGSGFKDYRATGEVCGIALPPGLRDSERLAAPIFTPATKATNGHDQNIRFEELEKQVGGAWAEALRRLSLELYRSAAAYAEQRGLLLADTKFEFGLRGDRLVWIDEALTPDSSRFWPLDSYAPGRPQGSFDKQFVRDYLDSLAWDKRPPGPLLPSSVVERTLEKYLEAFTRLTGRTLSLVAVAP